MSSKLPDRSIEEKIYAATRVPEPRPEFLASLSFRLSRQTRNNEPPLADLLSPRGWLSAILRHRTWAAALIVLITFLTAFLAIGPQRVIAAMGNLFGYLPGIGLVQNGADLRVLAGPVQLQREGITLTVEQGASDPQRTVIIYRIEGLSLAAANSQGEGAITGGLAVLLLPDGRILTSTGASLSGWGTGYQARLVFPPLPRGGGAATLVIQRLDTMPPHAAPEDWQVPVHFKPAPPDIKIMPVYELATSPASSPGLVATVTAAAYVDATATPDKAAIAAAALSEHETALNGAVFKLERVIELADGYELQGSLSWDAQAYSNLSPNPMETQPYSLRDANGQSIPFEEVQPDLVGNPPPGPWQPWGIRTNSKSFAGPWRLSILHLQADRVVQPGQAVIHIDFGSDPQPGQTWTLNQQLNIEGHSLRATTASMESDPRSGGLVLQLAFTGDPGVTGAGVEDPQNQPDTSGGGGGGGGGGGADATETPGQFTTSIPYFKKPAGVHQIQVINIGFLVDGPWSIRWDPPINAGQPTATPAGLTCLTSPGWAQLESQAQAALPQGLSGRLLVEDNQGQLMPRMSLVSVDGSQRQDLVTGGWSSLSPDGKMAAFVESSGPALFTLDLSSGVKQSVPGTTAEDYHPVWSPDGNWLAFVRGNAGIYVIKRDGSGLRQVVDAGRIRFLAGWLPDGSGLVITSLTGDGSLVQTVDLASGQIQDRFVIKNAKGGFVQLAPDGRRVAFSEMAFGLPSYGVYVANLDGSQKHLLAGLETGGASAGAWSPDGKWLALTVTSMDGAIQSERIVLVQADICQAWVAPGIMGRVTGWAAPSP